jgi:CheY-like chemotaxis protein
VKVLVVDDEALVRHALKRAFEKRGHTVGLASDGREALTMWNDFSPDLVYLDVIMPGLSGPDLLQTLTPAMRGQAKVLLMSAFAGGFDLERARALGADLFIGKPFEDVFQTVQLGEELARVR